LKRPHVQATILTAPCEGLRKRKVLLLGSALLKKNTLPWHYNSETLGHK
jgi:hypothetical protein